jgi:hypothetical protein
LPSAIDIWTAPALLLTTRCLEKNTGVVMGVVFEDGKKALEMFDGSK